MGTKRSKWRGGSISSHQRLLKKKEERKKPNYYGINKILKYFVCLFLVITKRGKRIMHETSYLSFFQKKKKKEKKKKKRKICQLIEIIPNQHRVAVMKLLYLNCSSN